VTMYSRLAVELPVTEMICCWPESRLPVRGLTVPSPDGTDTEYDTGPPTAVMVNVAKPGAWSESLTNVADTSNVPGDTLGDGLMLSDGLALGLDVTTTGATVGLALGALGVGVGVGVGVGCLVAAADFGGTVTVTVVPAG
jgi:hypothetical protein